MTAVFALPVSAVSPDNPAFRARLSPARLTYIDRLHGTARTQSFAASLLLDHVMQQCFPAIPRPLVLRAAENSKPYLENAPTVHFSLSHSSEWAVCAVSDQPIGVDIQQCSSDRRDIARRFFHPEEVRWLNSLSPADREDVFFTLWALKESYVKRSGRGLRDLRHFCVDISNGQPRVTEGDPCTLFSVAFPDPHYRLAVCAAPESTEPHVTILHSAAGL